MNLFKASPFNKFCDNNAKSVACLAMSFCLISSFSFTISVEINSAPEFTAVPDDDDETTATVGSYYSFQFGINDANGHHFDFTVPTRPSWLSYNSSNYTIYGTPSSSDISATNDVTVQAADCGQETSFSFSIVVTN